MMQRILPSLFLVWINSKFVLTGIVTWELRPGILRIGGTMTLTCTIQNVDTIDNNMPRQWSKGAELIAYNGHLDKPSKYTEILTPTNEFSLLIKNLTVSDVTAIYQCQYSFEACTKGLDIDSENFEYPPSDKTTHVLYNYTTEGSTFIQLHFTKVFPLPNCTIEIQNKQFNFEVDSVNNYTIYLEVNLIYTLGSEIECDLQPTIVCKLIGHYPVHVEQFIQCKNYKEDSINLLVILLPLFCSFLLIVTVGCVVLYHKRRQTYHKENIDYHSTNTDEIIAERSKS
ncbi:uncharacterized protein LOC143059097 [Mytilus galloprovincialis]|uniref:uncharacterized protein LOC143059097 n=1 Tax=Mytilus galloprovincialis TaxID=29158 RepID=UPI003F7C3B05